MKSLLKLRTLHLLLFFQSTAIPPLLPSTSTDKHASNFKVTCILSSFRELERVSDRNKISGWYLRASVPKLGIALGLLKPRKFQLRIFISPGSPGCQDLPLKNS